LTAIKAICKEINQIYSDAAENNKIMRTVRWQNTFICKTCVGQLKFISLIGLNNYEILKLEHVVIMYYRTFHIFA
jgi:hypothetical protein